MGFDVPAEATPNDMVVALRLDDADGPRRRAGRRRRGAARRRTGRDGRAGRGRAAAHHRDAPCARTPTALALVSVPGASALVEAMDALDAGRDVMVFSDNVPLEQELALKRTAAERGLLVMGPDCGTAVVGGLGLGFANTVAPGRSASSPRPAPAASSCSPSSTTPASASPPRSASAAATCPPRSAGCPPARRCAASTPTPRSS